MRNHHTVWVLRILWILEEEENVEESGRRLQSWRRDDAIDSNDYSSHE
jgi:hypothetical protein